MRFFQNSSYLFIEKRRTAYIVSSAVLLVGIAAMVFNVATMGSWQRYGVDFEGGSLVQVQFHDPISAGDLRDALGGASAPEVTQFGDASLNEFVIRAPLADDASITEVAEGIEQQLAAALGNVSFDVRSTELVGAKVGEELQTKALLAILFSMLLTLAYLAIRFEVRFGLAAVIATAHDILVTLGFLALFRVEIALPTVAAILTILGYSLNDTIVVFDRIRENMQKKGARKRDPIALVDQSINETLPRTVLTSGTTLVVLLSLLFLGGAVIRDFTIVLILGVVVGTYSSIFVASPALIEIQKRWGMGKSREKGAAPARYGVTESFDSHCHLTDAAFRDDREAVLRRASSAGVTRIVTIASDVTDAESAVALAESQERLWCTAGVHPHEAGAAEPDAIERVRDLATRNEAVVAIGETGLDYHYDNAPRPTQRRLFEEHLGLGAELGLPVVVHAREADDDVAAALAGMPDGTVGVLHCFTGGPKAFAEAMRRGWYVSFSGIASFKSFGPVDLLREVPDDRLLIETDAPYLAPVPHRGKRNEPAYVVRVAEAVAAHLETSAEEVARRTTENACRFYGVA